MLPLLHDVWRNGVWCRETIGDPLPMSVEPSATGLTISAGTWLAQMYRFRGTCCILDLGFQVAARRSRGQNLSEETVQHSVYLLGRGSLRLGLTTIHDLDVQSAAALPYDQLFVRHETCGVF
jgi:hypothetical protein